MKLCCFLTSACPHNCASCNVKRELGNSIASADEWIAAIKATKPSFVILFGGEPMLHPQWEDIAKFLKRSRIPYTVFSTYEPALGHPMTVSVDTAGDARSEFGIDMLRKVHGTVANIQIRKDNFAFALATILMCDRRGWPWLADLHHAGLKVDGTPFVLRSNDKDNDLTPDQMKEVSHFLAQHWYKSLETAEVYHRVIKAATQGWRCSPEHEVGYLTVAPDTSLMACVDLKLDETIYAKDYPERKQDYIDARVRARDTYCNGCHWRHEISAEMNPRQDWSTEGMLARRMR